MAGSGYTYEDFLADARRTGLLERFSAEDLRMAEALPEAGRRLLSYMEDRHSAQTDEAGALADAGAERVRSAWSGGSGAFSYDADADPAYRDFRKAMLREGQRAFENTLGAAAANTGGIASTAAVTAAQQAQNYYGAQAADRRSELTRQAYENWMAGRTLEAQERSARAAEEQQRFDNAVELWKDYGYVTPAIAETLGLPAGTAYSEQAYNRWYQSFQEGKEGVYTGQRLGDTANPRLMKQELALAAEQDRAEDHSELSAGSVGSEVRRLQEYLVALDYSLGGYAPDGDFGSRTTAAVRSFQSYHHLPVTGVVDAATWAEILATMRRFV